MADPAGDSIDLLLVDDEPELADLVGTYLERESDRIAVETATDAAAALERIRSDPVDCVVCDHDMPGRDGLDLLREVRETHPDLPFILYTGKGSEEIASDAVSAGVTDYLQKETGTDQYAVLANRVERAVDEQRAKAALAESERRHSTLISNLPGMVYRCRNERDWPMEFVSDGAEELTGYTAEQLESGEVSWGEDVLLDEERQDLWERVQTALDAREPFEVTYRIQTNQGSTRWVWERGRGVHEDGERAAIEGFITDITARKERENELEAAQKRYRMLIDTAPDPILLADAETGTVVDANRAATELLGYDEDELVGMHQTELVPDGKTEAYADLFEEHVEAGEAVDAHLPDGQDLLLVTADGEEVPVEVSASVVELDDRVLLQAFVRDVAERRERERNLERYRTLVESVGDPMYVADSDGHIEMVNRALADSLGYDRPELIGEHVSKLMVEADVERGMEVIRELLESEDRRIGSFELRTVARDGTRTVCEDKVAVLVEDGEFRGTVGVVRDISERKRRERELERFETIIQAVGDPVYALDDDGRFTFVNDAMEAVTGYAADELVGEHISIVIGDEDARAGEALIRDLLGDPGEDYETFEMDLFTRDGGRIPCENHVALLPLDDGEFQGTAGVIRDISERKRREQRLEQFASVVSHDLQNPLNVVMGRIELARDTGQVDHLDAAADAADQMEELIEDLLQLARQGDTVGETRPVDLDRIATDATETVDLGGATLDAGADRRVEADPDRLRELFENLLVNAVDHGDADRIRVGAFDGGFFVADDGAGIPADDRDKVFEHGYTTAEDGTGFGLAIVENIAAAHGWSVGVTESREGGARFEVALDD